MIRQLARTLLVPLSAFALLTASASVAQTNQTTQSPQRNPDDWKENYAYTLGVQAFTFGFPYIYMPELRWAFVANPPPNDMTPYAPVNHFFHWRRPADASYRGGGGANNDTLYSTAWLDLSKEPLILSHGEMGERYFYFQLVQMDSDNFGGPGQRLTGGHPASFALVGPNWQGKLPRGIKKIYRSQTNHNFILARTLVQDLADAKEVNKLQDKFSLVPLSLWGKKDAVLPASRDVWKPLSRKTDPLADWKTLNRSLAENPPEARLAPMMRQFATIGIGPGLDVEAQDEATKRGLARAAVDARQMLVDINRSRHPFMWIGKNGWDISVPSFGHMGKLDQYLRRAVGNYAGVCAPESEEASYYQSNSTGTGELYDGSKAYTLTFPRGGLPKVSAFWSLTIYDTSTDMTYNLVPNPINRYSIGDRTKDLKFNPDGSLTIYIQGESPGKDKESNWLPSPPQGYFALTMRAYVPGKEIVEQRWFPPAVQPVNTK